METKKKKKQKMMKTSLPCRENIIRMPIPENSSNAKHNNIGCMSGIFHFLSRHTHNSSRKRLSVERRKKTSSPATKETTIHQTQNLSTVQEKTSSANKQVQRHSCVVQRSPTLPSEIRRSSSVELSSESPRRPTPLVVKLMGLDEIPVITSPKITNNVSDQKRRKLLSALEKCDSDLKSLKKIIDAVSEANEKRDQVMLVGRLTTGYVELEKECQSSFESVKSVDSCSVEQPSPVSVLHPISSPTYYSIESMNAKQTKSSDVPIRLKVPDQHFSGQFSSGNHVQLKNEPAMESYQSIFHQITASDKLPRTMQKRNENEYQLEEFTWVKRVIETQNSQKKCERSNAMVETVSEICENGTREPIKEFAKVAFGIERGIFSDLVDDMIEEFSCCQFEMLISQGSCRKRLCF